MPTPKYHRHQAQILAGLALATKNASEVDRFTRAAMEHLIRAQALESDPGPFHTPGPTPDKHLRLVHDR
jgi:hypothetical protein